MIFGQKKNHRYGVLLFWSLTVEFQFSPFTSIKWNAFLLFLIFSELSYERRLTEGC